MSVTPVQDLFSFQQKKDLKLARKLTGATLNPSHFQKVKVSYDMQGSLLVILWLQQYDSLLNVRVTNQMCLPLHCLWMNATDGLT